MPSLLIIIAVIDCRGITTVLAFNTLYQNAYQKHLLYGSDGGAQ